MAGEHESRLRPILPHMRPVAVQGRFGREINVGGPGRRLGPLPALAEGAWLSLRFTGDAKANVRRQRARAFNGCMLVVRETSLTGLV